MEKTNFVKHTVSKVILGMLVVTVFMVSSCKKDANVVPDGNKASAPVQSQVAVSGQYKTSQPIVLNGAHDMTISGYSISGGSASCIDLTNCYNIHITGCRLSNSDKMAISLSVCKNVIVDNCEVSNVQKGVYAFNSGSIEVKENTFKSILGSAHEFVAFENTDAAINDPSSNKATDNQVQ